MPFRVSTDKHKIKYDDGEQEWLRLAEEDVLYFVDKGTDLRRYSIDVNKFPVHLRKKV